MTTLALFLDPWRETAAAPPNFRNPASLWRKAVWFKANPRSAAYMEARLREQWPDADFVDVTAEASLDRALGRAERVVLLYPDAIGLGFSRLERAVLARVPRAAVSVLNGRRRSFALDRRTRARLLLRRALERSMIVECVLGALMLAATPFLVAFDYARGRR